MIRESSLTTEGTHLKKDKARYDFIPSPRHRGRRLLDFRLILGFPGREQEQ